MTKQIEAFEAWWADTGEQSLYALNTTTDDDIKILAGIAWEAAIREALAQPVKQEPVAWWNGKETAWFEHELCGWQAPDGCTIPLYAVPVSAEAIRAEALEEAAKLCEQGTGDAIQTETLKLLLQERGRIASVIRGLKLRGLK